MSGLCRDCAHWRKNVVPDVLARTSVCLRVDISGSPHATALSSGTMAIVSIAAAELKTGPEFGCVQFEAKP